MAAQFDVDTCQAAPRRSWVGDFCRMPVDRSVGDNMRGLLCILKMAIGVSAIVKSQHDAAPDKFAKERVVSHELVKLPSRWSHNRKGASVEFVPTLYVTCVGLYDLSRCADYQEDENDSDSNCFAELQTAMIRIMGEGMLILTDYGCKTTILLIDPGTSPAC
jgi:hypothetical protein